MNSAASEASAAWRTATVCLIVMVVGLILGHAARWFADGLAVNAQLYFHAFRIAYVHSPWVLAPLRFLSGAVLQSSALASWSCACGYWCARATTRSTNAWLAGFSLAAFLGTVLTTTSVRAAQPWFFDTAAASIYPALVKLLFVVVPAWIVARANRNQSTSMWGIVLVAAIGIVLAWFQASDLGYALTFGCVIEAGSRSTPCVSGNIPWGTGAALVLTALSGGMAWDAVRGPLAR